MVVQHDGNTRTITEAMLLRYTVVIADDYFIDGDPAHILGFQPAGRRLVVIDHDVLRIYGSKIGRFFHRHGIEAEPLVVSLGEREKTAYGAMQLLREFQARTIPLRTEPIILIGGGALMAVGSIAAALDEGGRPFVRVCTSGEMWDFTISGLSMIHQGTPGVATYHEPVVTIVDRAFLGTLPEELIRSAVAQQVKVAAISDSKLFDLLEAHGESLILDRFQGKTRRLERLARKAIGATIDGGLSDNDGRPRGADADRMLLFGHTWSAAFQDATRNGSRPLTHGEAVSLDIALSAVLSWRLGLLSEHDRDRVLNLLTSMKLPTRHHLMIGGIVMRNTNEIARWSRGSQAIPLMTGIGQGAFVADVPPLQVKEAGLWLHRTAAWLTSGPLLPVTPRRASL